MERLEVIPRWMAGRLSDDVAIFLRVTPGPDELSEYYEGLLELVDALESAVRAIRQAVDETVVA